MKLIPAIDLRHGAVVRLRRGDDRERTAYDVDPRQVLRDFASAGVPLAHVVDLDAAFGESPQRRLIGELAAMGRPRLEVGGGLRDREGIEAALEAGCERLVLGSLAVLDPAAFAELAASFPGRLVPALEVSGGELKVGGWTASAPRRPLDAARDLRGLPCAAVLVTDVQRDGMLAGPNLDLARQVAEASGLQALVSGGVRSLDDLSTAASAPEVGGIIVGKALYEGLFTLEDAVAACAAGEAA